MARIRSIKPEFWEDERIGSLSMGARLLYLGLISLADDEGRLRASPTLVKAQVFPYDAKADVPGWMKELEDAKRIIRYAFDGESFAAIGKFKKHQKIDKPSPSKLPSPEDPQAVTLDSPSHREDSPRPRRGFATIRELSTTDQEQGSGSGRDLGSGPGGSPPAPSARHRDLVFAHWKQVLHPEARVFDKDTQEAVDARLAEGFSVDDLKRAIDGCKSNPHNQGVNERGKRYDSLELICRTGPNVHRFMGYLAPAKVDVRKGHVRAEDMDFSNIPIGEVKIL